MNLDRLLRKHLKGLKPYQSARDEYTGREGIFLDANENPLGSATEEAFNRYPDPYQQEVKAALALVKLIREPYIFLGNGSDEAIDLLYRAFCEPGEDHVILLPPTYGMYKVSAQINGVDIREVSLAEDFQLDVEAIRARVSPMTKLIFICSPNNPTGNLMDREAIRQVIEMAPGLVVVDEAYADFAPDQSVLHWVREYPNLVVLQTFSKAWGLANLRLGMAFADPAIIQILNQIKPPYNVNGLTQRMALEALKNRKKMQQQVSDLLEEREKLQAGLSALPLVERVYPSDANFLLVKVPEPDRWYQELIDKRIIVRNRSRVHLCEGCLRITVGRPFENRMLLEVLAQLT